MLNQALPIAAGIAASKLAEQKFGAQLAKLPVPLWLSAAAVGVAAGIFAKKFVG